MKNFYLITKYSIKEAFARKIFIAFLGISSFILLVSILLSVFISMENLLSTLASDLPAEELISEFANGIKVLIAMPLFGFGLILAVFTVSSIIPQMLEKGSIDLILSKPISRAQIILGKFKGGLLVVLINVFYLIIGIWLIIGLKFGNWDTNFLLAGLTITFTFASLYSIIIFVGILTQSSVFSMMISYFIFLILSPLLSLHDQLDKITDNKIIQTTVDAFYYLVPKTSELGSITRDMIMTGDFEITQPVISTAIFIFLTLAASIIIFNKKDY